MRKREIRGYSRFSGVEMSRGSTLRTGGFAVLVFGLVIGVCGLATTVTQQTDRLVASTAQPQTTEQTTPVGIKGDSSTGTPAAMLTTIPSATPPSTTMASQTTSVMQKQPVPVCNPAKRSLAATNRADQLRRESARHKNTMWSLQTTGIVAKFLNPYMYNRQLSQEMASHQAVLKQIQHNYVLALARAHC